MYFKLHLNSWTFKWSTLAFYGYLATSQAHIMMPAYYFWYGSLDFRCVSMMSFQTPTLWLEILHPSYWSEIFSLPLLPLCSRSSTLFSLLTSRWVIIIYWQGREYIVRTIYTTWYRRFLVYAIQCCVWIETRYEGREIRIWVILF